MTPEQSTEFEAKGCLYLGEALSKQVVQPIKTRILDDLKRLNIWSSGRTLSQRLKGVPIFQQTDKLGQWIAYPDLHQTLMTASLSSAMEQLAQRPLLPAQSAPLLISLPQKDAWTLTGLNWHRDIAQSQTRSIPGIQAFVLLDDVPVHGGATLALAGSHRLSNPTTARQRLEQLSKGGVVSVEGCELSLVEMSGRAGDVYLMDMRVLHTPSINASKKPRLMATMRRLVDAH